MLSSETALKELRDSFKQVTSSMTKELDKLKSQREQAQRELDRSVENKEFSTLKAKLVIGSFFMSVRDVKSKLSKLLNCLEQFWISSCFQLRSWKVGECFHKSVAALSLFECEFIIL